MGFESNFNDYICFYIHAQVGLGIASDCTKVFKDHDVSIKDTQDLSSLASQKLGKEMRKLSLGSLTERLVHKQVTFGNF